MPAVVGQQWPDAKKALIAAKLNPVERVVRGPDKGKVSAVSPKAGTPVAQGSKVTVNVEAGITQKQVPDVRNESLAQATSDLNAAGFNVKVGSYVQSNQPANTVISQTPNPGTQAPQGSSVTLTLSKGPPQVNVPDVTTETQQQATSDLQHAGFQVVTQYVNVSDPSQDGIVQSQTPSGGTQANQGATVTIYVGQYTGTTTGTTTTTGFAPKHPRHPHPHPHPHPPHPAKKR